MIASAIGSTSRFLIALVSLLLFLLLPTGGLAQGWYSASWQHRKAITIDRTKVSGGPHVEFPVLINLPTDSDLAAKAQSGGDDIFFTTFAGIKLDHELERYTSATGTLVAWVKVPSISSAGDTTIFMYYGNPAAASQQNSAVVWSDSYHAVYHLNENNLNDSTANARHGTSTGSVDAVGRIANGRDFESSTKTDNVEVGTWSVSGSALTIQAWVRFESLHTQYHRIISKSSPTDTGAQGHVFMLSTDTVSGAYRIRGRIKTGTSDTGGSVQVTASSGNLAINTWYFVAATYDGANLRLFLNGAEVGNLARTGNLRVNSWPVTLGNNNPANNYEPLDGILDELRVSSSVRSADWIASEYNNQNSPSTFSSITPEQTLGNHALFVSQSVPSTMVAGQTYSVSLTMKNLGTTTWRHSDGYRLGSENAQNNTTWGLSRVTLPGTRDPNQDATFTFNVTAPAIAGTYNFQWRMLRENVEWFGNLTPNLVITVEPSVASFNVVEPGAHAVNGKVFTKIAGQNFVLDVVALDHTNAVASGFTGTVAVEVVDATSGGACAGLPLIAALTNQTFAGGEAGRKALSAPNTVTNVFRNARIRVKFPTSSPTIVACSADNFAIRPASLSFTATDENAFTEGTARTLQATTLTGTPTHRAGRPFRITATAYNGAATPALASNYNGTPAAVLSPCADSACTATFGTLTLSTWSASGGSVTNTNVRYHDVGAFNLQLEDAGFASVDASDGTPLAQRTVSSAPVAIGRFTPDLFEIAPISVTPRRDIPACSASPFSYMGEAFEVAFSITAISSPTIMTTAHYTGSLARLALNDPNVLVFGAIAGSTSLTSRLSVLQTSGTWINGVATVTALVALQRAAAPDGPYGLLRIGIRPTDLDGVTNSPAYRNLDTSGDGTNDRLLVGTHAVRFGRLRLQNASGSQLVALPIPIEAQHWNGTAFVRNTEDNCTSISADNVALGNFQRSLTAAHTSVTLGGAFNAGLGSLTLSAPGAAHRGSVDLAVNLGAAGAGASCVAGMPVSTPSNRAYLQGAWCGAAFNRDPTARASFGVLRAPDRLIYRRENF